MTNTQETKKSGIDVSNLGDNSYITIIQDGKEIKIKLYGR